MLNSSSYFILFSSSILVKGVCQTAIIDLQRKQLNFIPNSLFQIIQECKTFTIKEVYKKYSTDTKTLDEYFKWLLNKEVGFFGTKTDIDSFPKMPRKWDFPSLISNAILDWDKDSNYNILDSVEQLDELNCFHIQFRFYSVKDNSIIDNILKACSQLSFRSLEIVLPLHSFEKMPNNSYIESYSKLSSLIIYGCDIKEYEPTFKDSRIKFIDDNIDNCHSCGVITPSYFSTSVEHYTESLKFNTCLNRKISIDVNGEIKNCPSMKKSYGNIKNTTLIEALNKKGFKDVWHIKKDDIKFAKIVNSNLCALIVEHILLITICMENQKNVNTHLYNYYL